jgi:hypothetical protein
MLRSFMEARYWAKKGDFLINSRFRTTKIIHYFKNNYYDQFGNILSEKMLSQLCVENTLIDKGWRIYANCDNIDIYKLIRYHKMPIEEFTKKDLSFIDCINADFSKPRPDVKVVFLDIPTKICEKTPLSLSNITKDNVISDKPIRLVHKLLNKYVDTLLVAINEVPRSDIQYYLDKYDVEYDDTLYNINKSKQGVSECISDYCDIEGWLEHASFKYSISGFVIIDGNVRLRKHIEKSKFEIFKKHTIMSSKRNIKKETRGITNRDVHKAIKILDMPVNIMKLIK